MSVTFRPDAPFTGLAVQCACGTVSVTPDAQDYQSVEAQVSSGTLAPRCGDDFCGAHRPYVVPTTGFPQAPEFNLSNVNARFVLSALGFADDEDLCGTERAEDFLGRILVAEALSPVDEGVPAHQAVAGQSQVIECGRPAGYLQQRLRNLHEVAEFAQRHDLEVCWS